MSRADDGLRALLQKHLPKPAWRWTPVESGGTHNGIPDSFYLHREARKSGWVESKATRGWAVDIEPHQVQWLATHAAGGVRCFVAVRARGVGSAEGRGDSLWLLRGAAAAEIAELGLRCDPSAVLGRWLGPPQTWDWTAVHRILVS